MQHVEPDRLALAALGEPVGADDTELTDHLSTCAECRQELQALRATVELARETIAVRAEPLQAPAGIWDGIAAELDLADGPSRPAGPALPDVSRPDVSRPDVSRPDVSRPDVSRPDVSRPDVSRPDVSRPDVSRLAGPDHPEASRPDAPGHPDEPVLRGSFGREDVAPSGAEGPGSAEDGDRRAGSSGRHRRDGRPAGGRRWARTAAALAAAAAVGVLGTLVAVRPWTDAAPAVRAASAADLEPVVSGPAGVHGRATVVQGAAGPELRVTTTGLPLQNGFYQVWVFDGRDRMQAVGVLGKDSAATLPLPETLDLRTYNVVDISLEPYDGDQTHSKDSVLRGTLTT